MKQVFKLFLQDFNKKTSQENNWVWFLSLPFKVVFWLYVFIQFVFLFFFFSSYFANLNEIVGFLFGKKYPGCDFQAFESPGPYLFEHFFYIYIALWLRKKSLIWAYVFVLGIHWIRPLMNINLMEYIYKLF